MAMMAVGDINVPSLSTVGKFEFQSWQGRLKVFTTYANIVLVLKIQNYNFISSKVSRGPVFQSVELLSCG